MSASPLHGSPARQRRARVKGKTREQLAFEAGEAVLDGTSHGVTLLLYYKYLVARAERASSSLVSQPVLARENGVSTRTIRRYDDLLIAAGLIWLRREGTSYRRFITAYEAEHAPEPAQPAAPAGYDELIEQALDATRRGDLQRSRQLLEQARALVDGPVEPAPEAVAVDAERPEAPFFGAANADRSIRLMRTDRSGSLLLTGSIPDQGEAPPPNPPVGDGGGDQRPDVGFFGREERPEARAETVALLRDAGLYPATVRKYAALDPAWVRQQIREARSCGRAREEPRFLAFVLGNGGVYGAPRASPAHDDPNRYLSPLVSMGDTCPNCDRVLRIGDEGVCPRCNPPDWLRERRAE